MTPLQIFRQFYPYFMPNIYQQDLLEQVDDLVRFRTAVEYWASNDYRPQSVGKLLNYYAELGKQQINAQVGKYDPTYSPPEDQGCSWCHKDYCLDTHREERDRQIN